MSTRTPAPARPPTTLLGLVLLLVVACAGDRLDAGFVSCGVPGCDLPVAAGSDLGLRSSAAGRQIVHRPTGLAADVVVLTGPDALAEARARAEAIAAEMAPRVAWSQDDARNNGFSVDGYSGMTRASGLLAPNERQWFARFVNPRTGSVLLLHLRGAVEHWDAAWADLEPTLTRVQLSPAF